MGRTWTELPSPAALAAAGQREIGDLAQLLATAQPGDSVHGARRRIKQLRSLLRLLRVDLGEDCFQGCNTALRAAADALAGHRRAEALVTAATKLEDGRSDGFWLARAEAHRAAHAAEGDPARALADAQAAIAKAARLLSELRMADSGGAVPETFRATYRKARRRLRSGLHNEAAPDLHAARTFVIHHLHQLKLLYPGEVQRLAALEALREVLGDLNDLDELEQLAAGAEVPAGASRRMRKSRRRLLARARRAFGRLFRHKAQRFAKRLGHAAKPRSRRAPLALQAGE